MTSLEGVLAEGRIVREGTDRIEIGKLLVTIDEDIADSEVRGVSPGGRFRSAYAAIRSLATTVVRASGFRVRSSDGGHRLTFEVLALLETSFHHHVSLFNRWRRLRNDMMYTGGVTVASEAAEEIIHVAKVFRTEVLHWIKAHHPELS
jgi:hypothetical protein